METEINSNQLATENNMQPEQNALPSTQPDTDQNTKGDGEMQELNRETINEGSCENNTRKETVVIESVIQLLPPFNEANSSSATSVGAETETGPSNDLVIAQDTDIIEIMDVTQTETVDKSNEAQLVTIKNPNDKSLSSQTATEEVLPIKGASTSLGLLSQYGSDADEDDSSESETESVVEVHTDANKKYRSQVVEIDSDSIETISSSSESETESLTTIAKVIKKRTAANNDDDDDDNSEGEGKRNKKGGRRPPLRVRGEMLLEDLPPIQDLQISVPAEECIEFGHIHSIVDQLLLVSALPNSILLDLDTVLFLEKGKRVLGEVFDVLGQVADPIYCVRFNTNQHIHEKGINIGDVVYVAPKTEYTQYVILSNLMQMRGSDASWENDTEPPLRYLEYSDDEEEREARTQWHKNRRRSIKEDVVNDDHDDDKDNNPMKRGRKLNESVSVAEMQQRCERPSSSRRSAHTGIYQNRHERFAPRQYSPHSYQPHHSTSSWHSHYRQQYQPRSPSYLHRLPYPAPFHYQRPLFNMVPPEPPRPFSPFVFPPASNATPQGQLHTPMGHSMPPPQMTPPSPTVYVPNPHAFQSSQMEQPSRIQPPNPNQNVAEPAPPGAD